MDISAAGSAIYASFGSANADSLTGSIRSTAQAEQRAAPDSATQASQAAASFGGGGKGDGGSVTPNRGNLVNVVV